MGNKEYSVSLRTTKRMYEEIELATEFTGLSTNSDWVRFVAANALLQLRKSPSFRDYQRQKLKEKKKQQKRKKR